MRAWRGVICVSFCAVDNCIRLLLLDKSQTLQHFVNTMHYKQCSHNFSCMSLSKKQQDDQFHKWCKCALLIGNHCSHLSRMINHCKSFGYFMPLCSRMTNPNPVTLNNNQSHWNWYITVHFSCVYRHTQSETNQFISIRTPANAT